MYTYVESEDQVRAGHGRARGELRRVVALFIDRPARGVHEDLLESGLAVQLVLVGALDTDFADEAGPGIFGAVNLLQVFFVDGADIAYGMNRNLLQRVVAREPGVDVDAGELPAMHGEQCHLIIVQLQLDGHAFIDLMQQDGAPDVRHFGAAQHADAGELRERAIQCLNVPHLLAHQFDLVGGPVLGQHDAVTIEDQSAAGRDRVGAHAVALREFGVVLVSQDLQEKQAPSDGQEQCPHEHARDDAAERENALLGPVILDADATYH